MLYELLKVGKAVDSLDDPVFEDFAHYAEEKVDGVGAMMLWDDDGRLLALTPKRDVTRCFPDEIQEVRELAGWILQVEVVAGCTSSDVATFLSKGGWKAAKDPGVVVLDVLRTGSGDQRSLPFIRRRSLSGLACSQLYLALPDLKFTVRQPDWSMMTKREFAERIVADGGEGVVFKNVNEDYYAAGNWVKYKAVRSVDCAVRSYIDGNGKYEGGLGALVLELKVDKEWVQVGTCSGMTDAERIGLKKRLDNKRSFVAEVKFQQWTSGGKLRHPRFVKVRTDKKLSDCTWAEQGPEGRS